MKIAFVGAANSPHVIKWANAMAAQGHGVSLYSMPNHKDSFHELSDNVEVAYLPFAEAQNGAKKNAAQLKAYLDAGKFGAVAAFDMMSYGLMAAKANAAHVLLVSTGLDIYNAVKSGKKSIAVKSIKHADAVCATAANIITKMKEIYKKEKQYFVTPFGVDMERFKKKDVPKGESVCFGSIKFLDYANHIDLVIEAFSKFLQKTNIDAILKVAGDGALETDLKRKAQDLGIGEKVEFLGYIKNEEMPDVINSMDVVVQMTADECLGISGIEAMACEVPLVASDTYGASEYILNGVTGYLVKAGNTNACSDRMADLARDPQGKAKMGVSCREDVMEKYNMPLCIEKFEAALKAAGGSRVS